MTISNALRGDAYSNESDLPLILLTITHATLTAPIRVVNNRTNITSNGEVYTAFPFELVMPEDAQDAPPRARVIIANATREIGQVIRMMDSAAEVTIEVVRQQSLDTVEISLSGFRTGSVTWNSLTVEFDLVPEDLMREPYPAPIFSPAEFPGLVR